MNFDDTPQEAAFRAEARAWIQANAPKQFEQELVAAELGPVHLRNDDILEVSRAWQKKKADDGWACLQWPKEYGGRAASAIERVIWQQEESVFAKLHLPFFVGQAICAPALMTYGNDQVKQRYLPPLASGEEIWCQLFSEPSAGSDLAALRTRAERDGDGWRINGQKVWTSGAHYSSYGLLLARTDPAVPKHKGLTAFVLEMKSPGVEIRPIKQITGEAEFSEVYFSDVRIPDALRMGEVNMGWDVALTMLMNERFAMGGKVATGFADIFELCCNLTIDGIPAVQDPVIRSKLANWAVRNSGLKYTGYRTLSALSRGEQPGPENSIGKLVTGQMLQEIGMFAVELQGAAGLVSDPAFAEANGKFQRMLLRSPSQRISGGSDEIMRNVIAERVLGLPPDIRVDKDVAFNQVATQRR